MTVGGQSRKGHRSGGGLDDLTARLARFHVMLLADWAALSCLARLAGLSSPECSNSGAQQHVGPQIGWQNRGPEHPSRVQSTAAPALLQ